MCCQCNYCVRLRLATLTLIAEHEFGRRGMREVKNIANTLQDAVKSLRQRAQTTTEAFNREMAAAHEGINKLEAVTGELREANQQVQAALSDVGSNFPPPEEHHIEAPKADLNGVTLNKG